ncbi:Dabb family protein [Paenibacillus bovis]|uniref:Stress responsive protein n=1 Tax=Paenibacillus bovis TaxID=1616788 RepID=A0A172ZFF4_9BACL|nr:Dabb family protein [Paenibacillus bovis]ANF96338.1 stress responsive protein [Paenibacillus bovis]
MIKHIVLFKFKEASQDVIDTVVSQLRNLEGKVESLRSIEVGVDLIRSERSYDVALITTFDNMDGLQAYQVHPEHVKVSDYIGTVKESTIAVDYEY